ncbi:hypothetical protein ACOMHN_059084 [Nucella lapillus]
MKLWQVIVSGVVVHVILFYSIFDIYFTSPLVHGMTPYAARSAAPAKRLVLFVADGLRADKFFELESSGKPRTPYMRKVIEEKGAWGVSHTRVPTESRPGHVALIAGFYEDVSAVAKGWKENPVEFDSVFNESRNTWSWGSPDILPMFAKGASGDHVMTHSYPAHYEDFASSNISQLDVWVFKEVKKFFDSSKQNATLMRALQQDKLVFFLHLVGIDTNGHSNKPYSKEYLENIRVVDAGIRSMVDLVEDFYGHDDKTSYVMTADHGMTDWGSHGASHPDETLTPVVAWGAGVRHPRPTDVYCGKFDDNFCDDWRLQHRRRVDIAQADVAPLMAFLVGLPFPVNSVGALPVDYLAGQDYSKAEGLFANAQQILAQYQVKMKQVKDRTISATFRPFRELTSSTQVDLLRNVKHLISNGHFQDAIDDCNYIIHTALKGLRYYQTYDRFFLGTSVTLGFLGWMGYVLYLLLDEHTPAIQTTDRGAWKGTHRSVLYPLFGVIGLVVTLMLFVQSLPWTNYFYCLMPVLLWMKFAEGWELIKAVVMQAAKTSSLTRVLISIVLSLMGLEVIVLCFFYRELLSVGLVVMAIWAVSTPVWKSDQMACLCWMVSCILVAIFPLLPVVGRNANYPLVLLSGLVAVVLGGYMVWRAYHQGSLDIWSQRVLCIQLVLIGAATLVVKVTADYISYRSGTPKVAPACSWLILFISPLLPLLTGVSIHLRLVSLCLAFLAPYLLMSITEGASYEGLFMLCLMCMLYCWLQLETLLVSLDPTQTNAVLSFQPSLTSLDKKGLNITPRHLHIADLRRAFFFIFLILTAFFGTGNIASVNSFDPASVYCFVTIFSPFLMGGLMMLKVVLPFVVVTCVLAGIQVVSGVPLRALMLIVLLMTDFMGLNFLFLVRDEGSWREIGTSISHYVIVMSLITFAMILMGVAQILTSSAPLLRLSSTSSTRSASSHR